MSPIDLLGNGNGARAPSIQHATVGTRPGTEKAAAMQPSTTTHRSAPVETTQAVLQPGAGTKPAINPDPPPSSRAGKADFPIPTMTAVLLHELRLQQELADVQAKKDQAPGD